MKLDETKLQEVVEKIAYQQFGAEQIDDLYAKMGILNDYVQEQLRLFAVVGRSEQFYCTCSRAKGLDYDEDGKAYCIDCGKYLEQTIP
jgi:hypothetical protein